MTHRQIKFECVYWCMKGPRKLVLPQGLYHHFKQVLQLIGLALRPGQVDILWLWGVGSCLPLAAAVAARHLRCVHAVPHPDRVGHGLGPRSGSGS